MNRQTDIAAIARRSSATRAHAQVAQEINDRALTLIKDERNQVPLAVPRDANVLYLSVLDYACGLARGRCRAGRSMPELKSGGRTSPPSR